MDLLQVALVFLIALLTIFLTITGVQVFLILKDLKRALDRFNRILETGQDIAKDIEKPVLAAASVVSTIESGVKVVQDLANVYKPKSPTKPRFYKKVMK